jgi:hypothetical protein
LSRIDSVITSSKSTIGTTPAMAKTKIRALISVRR